MSTLKRTNAIISVYSRTWDNQNVFFISTDNEGICQVNDFGDISEFTVATVARAFTTVDLIQRMSLTEFKKQYPKIANEYFKVVK